LCADGRTLLDTLQMPVSSGSCNSLTAKADYTEGASHVLDVVHEVRLERIHCVQIRNGHLSFSSQNWQGSIFVLYFIHLLSKLN